MLRIASLCRLSLLLGLALMNTVAPLHAQQAPPIPPAAAQDTLDWKNSFTIPLVYDPLLSPDIFVYVSINEQEPMPFVLDTGASESVIITPQAAKSLHLLSTGETKFAHTKIKITKTKLSSVRFPLVGTNVSPAMMPFNNPGGIDAYVAGLPRELTLPNNKPIAGIIGARLWTATTIRLDFAAKTLNVWTPSHPPLHLPDAAMLPLKKTPVGNYYIALPIDSKHTYDFLLDTGADATHMPPSMAQALHVRAMPYEFWARMIGGSQHVNTGLLPSLPLGTLTPQDVGVWYPDSDADKSKAKLGMPDTILGINLLSRYRLVFDFRNMQLHLQPGTNYAEVARVLGLPAVRVSQRGAQARVEDVRMGTTAYRAGLRNGDALLSVDDVPAQDLSARALQFLTDGYGGTQAHLQVQQNGQTRTVTYRRYSLAVVSSANAIGLDVHMSAADRLFVTGAEKGFAAYKAGVRKGDEILAVDGKPVQENDFEALLDLLNNSKTNPLPVTILRKGETEPQQVQIDRQ